VYHAYGETLRSSTNNFQVPKENSFINKKIITMLLGRSGKKFRVKIAKGVYFIPSDSASFPDSSNKKIFLGRRMVVSCTIDFKYYLNR